MLKRIIHFEDFDGNPDSVEAYFHLSKLELIELEVEFQEGLAAAIQRIIAAEDRKAMINEFKRIILWSYGVRSEDGKRFTKTEAIRQAFMESPAYSALFMELATEDGKAAEFINGVLPADMVAQAQQQAKLQELQRQNEFIMTTAAGTLAPPPPPPANPGHISG